MRISRKARSPRRRAGARSRSSNNASRRLVILREIFRKACPKDEDNRSKRIWKDDKTVLFGRDSHVQTLLIAVQDNLRLLEQKDIYVIGDRLDQLQKLTKALGRDDGAKYAHSGQGDIIANEGGNPTNYVQGGSDNRMINNPGVYNENHTHNHLPPERPETPPKPSSNVPFRRDPHFVKRATLTDQIHDKLSVPAGRVALVGLGGVGKSQLAIEYAHQLRQQLPHAWVLWIHASNAARFEESLRDVADQLRLYGRKDPKANVLLLLQNWLRDESKGRWLIVLDNADDVSFLLELPATTGQPQLTRRRIDYIPASEHGSMIITTRSKGEARKLVYESDTINVPPMSGDEAEALLASKLGHPSSDDRLLAFALDCIPLAITQAAAYIRERAPRCSVQQYRDEMDRSRASRTSLLRRDLQIPNRDAEASNSVLLTWQISFEHVFATRRHAADLLSLMSFCDRLAIPESLIRIDRGGAKSSDSTSDFEEDIATLRNFSFVSTTKDPYSWEMHRLVQDATQAWLVDRGRLSGVLDQFVHCLYASFPTGHFENWPACRTLLPHAQGIADSQPTSVSARLEWAAVMYNCGWYANAQGRYNDALAMARSSMAIISEQLGREDLQTLRSMELVALTYSNQGRWTKAEQLYMRVMETMKVVLGEEHPSTLTSMAHLASTYQSQGRWTEAEQLYMKVIEMSKAVLGEEHPDMLTDIANLASTYYYQGRWAEAEQLLIKVMETSKAVLGVEHPSMLAIINNLASTYHVQGRWAEAEQLFLKIIDTKEALLGKEHPDTLTSMASLASTYQSQGRCIEAEQLFMKVIATSKAVPGEEHPDMLTAIASLASTYLYQGRWAEAKQLLMKVIATSKAVPGEEHPHTLTATAKLASIYLYQGHWAEAEQLFLKVIETEKALLGKEHPSSLVDMNNLASTYYNQGRWAETEQLFLKVIETSKAVVGEEHPHTLMSMNNLAHTYYNQERWTEAEALQTQAVNGYKKSYGPQHPSTLRANLSLGHIRRMRVRSERKSRWKLFSKFHEKGYKQECIS